METLSQVRQHIQILSKDARPMQFLPVDLAEESLEITMRRQAEASFQHALCRRIFWNLDVHERALIRAEVLKDEPYLKDRAEGGSFEYACCAKVQEYLKEEQKQANEPMGVH